MFKFFGLTLMLITAVAVIIAVCLKLVTPLVTTRKSTLNNMSGIAYGLLATAGFSFIFGIVFLTK